MNECLNVIRPGVQRSRPRRRGLSRGRWTCSSARSGAGGSRSALRALPADYQDVLVLRHFAELSYDDIAATLGIPARTVKSRLFTRGRSWTGPARWQAT